MADFQISTKYQGPEVNGQIDTFILANSLQSLAIFVDNAAAFAVGPDTRTTSKVVALRQSSFDFVLDFQLVRDGAAVAASMFPVLSTPSDVTRLAELLRASLAILRHLGGEKPTKTFNADRGGVAVENNNGVIQVFNADTVNFILSPGNSGLTENFIGKPIATEADTVDIKLDGESLGHVSRQEAKSFRDVSIDAPEHSSRADVVVRILKPALEGHAQWRLHDGASGFDAKIEDSSFLARVRQGEKFGRGDHLLVRLRSEQYRTRRGALRVRRYVESVIERVDPTLPEQTSLNM